MSRLFRRNRDLSQPLDRIELTVGRDEEGRFDRFLATHLSWRSRAGVRRLIETGLASVNGEARKPATRVRAGDRVVVDVGGARGAESAPVSANAAGAPGSTPEAEPELRVLYEDEHLLALDKPAGVVVHPVGRYQQGTLLQALHRRARESGATGAELPKLAHRLDQHTSGVLLVAKRDPVRTVFSDLLERGGVRKRYEALLLGRPAWERRAVDEPIGPVGDSRILMAVDREKGKRARSRFEVVERFAHATHVAVEIATGRTHQIRVHAAWLGHPLLGDHLYGDGLPVTAGGHAGGFLLHARSVRFAHPVSGAELEIEAPLPAAFREALASLRASPPRP